MDPESHKEASADLLGHPSLQISAQQSTDSERRTSRRVRKPRVVDEETKKRDDEFWKSNPLFKGKKSLKPKSGFIEGVMAL